MATSLAFRDHQEFHRAALHMAVAGGFAGLATHVAGLLYPALGGAAAPVPLAVVGGAVAFGAMAPRLRTRIRSLAVLLGAVALAAAGLKILGRTGPEPSLGAAAFAAVFAWLIARGTPGKRFLLAFAAAAAAALAARYVLGTFSVLAGAPPWVDATVAGAAFGVVATLALLPRHLELVADRIGDAWDALKDGLTGEPKDLANRAMAVWGKVDATLERESPVRRAIEDSVLRLLEMARRWHEVEKNGADTRPAESLVDRMKEIDEKIARTTDAVARGQYEKARAALAEQLRYVKEIADSRERVIARMHHYLAAMERLRFAVINHRSADASRLAAEVQPILDDLESLGQDIDCASEAMTEVEKEEAAAAAARNTAAAAAAIAAPAAASAAPAAAPAAEDEPAEGAQERTAGGRAEEPAQAEGGESKAE